MDFAEDALRIPLIIVDERGQLLAMRQVLVFFEPVWSQMSRGGIGCVSEVREGNTPHRPRGCYGYAPAIAGKNKGVRYILR